MSQFFYLCVFLIGVFYKNVGCENSVRQGVSDERKWRFVEPFRSPVRQVDSTARLSLT